MVAMTDSTLVAGGDWSAVDFAEYADEEDAEPTSSVTPLFVVLSLSSAGYPEEEDQEQREQGGGAIGSSFGGDGGSAADAFDQVLWLLLSAFIFV